MRRMSLVYAIVVACLVASASETQAREGFFARLFQRNSAGSTDGAIQSGGSTGGYVTSNGSTGGYVQSAGSTGGSYSVRVRPQLFPRVVVPMTSTVYEAPCVNCVE